MSDDKNDEGMDEQIKEAEEEARDDAPEEDEESPLSWETSASSAVEHLLHGAQWLPGKVLLQVEDHSGEVVMEEYTSLEELCVEMVDAYEIGWGNAVPFDGGVPVFTSSFDHMDASSLLSDKYADKIAIVGWEL